MAYALRGCRRQFTSPVDVRWEAMDAQLLRRFWERHAAERAGAADISDRVLVFHRGISDVRPSCRASIASAA